jgi:PAS domain S-box-containing protein
MVGTTSAESAKDQNIQQEALERILREVMVADKSLDEKARSITEIASGVLQVHTCAVLQGRPSSSMFRRVDFWDTRTGQHLTPPDVSIDIFSFLREAMERDRYICADDCWTWPLDQDRQEILKTRGIRSFLGAAACFRERSLGAITFGFGQPHHWTEEEITFAKSVANLVALLFAMDRGDMLLASLDQVPVGVYIEDKSGAVTYANRTARRLADSDGTDNLNKLPRPATSLSRDLDLHELSSEGKEFEVYRARLPDGGIMARISDVTERKAELARINTLLRSIVNSTNDMIWCVDPGEFRLTMFNRGLGDYYEKYRGFRIHVGMSQQELLPDERTRQIWRQMYRRALERGSFSTEYDVIADQRTLLLHINRLETGGKTCGLSVFGQDITETKKIQARLMRAQKMEAMGRAAAGVAHDFNNVLAAIGGFAQLLAHDLPSPSRQHDHAARIEKACRKGKDIVDQILTFARSSEIARSPLDLALLVQHCHDFKNDPLFAAVEFSIQAPDGSLPVLGNQTQIGQLISNLCLNARDARRDGKIGIRISADSAAPDEMVQLEQSQPRADEALIGVRIPDRFYCRLRIEDNGTGIAPDLMPRIFEPFFTTKDRRHGTGLGLAVVHGVVQSHHAICHVRSQVGRGTTFSIYFPRDTHAADHAAALATAGTATVHPGGERVLVVDDDPEITEVLTIGLERQGFQVTGFNDPLQALATFVESPKDFDVVISDNVMPSLSGKELLRRLREVDASVITVLCSGNIGSQSGPSVADLILSKPASAEQIAAAIRSFAATR